MSELFADREALIQWAENWAVEENLIDGDPEIIEALADALLASGVVRPLPDEEAVARAIEQRAKRPSLHWPNLDCLRHRDVSRALARAVLALFTEGTKE